MKKLSVLRKAVLIAFWYACRSPRAMMFMPAEAVLRAAGRGRRDMSEKALAVYRRMPRSVAFIAIAAIFVLYMAASSAPTPLYVVYQREFGFSATTLTIIFAIYVLGLIGSLLILGALSDHVGRRPVLVGAIALGASALATFGTLARLALPTERGALFAVAYVVAYLAFSLPAVVAGFASTSVGLRETAVVYSIVVIALTLAALAAQRLRAAHDRRE